MHNDSKLVTTNKGAVFTSYSQLRTVYYITLLAYY